MTHMEKSIVLTARMIERREQVRTLYGDRYESVVVAGKKLIQAVVQRDGIPIMSVALKVCEEAVKDGYGDSVSVLIAAMCDLVEEG